MLELTLNFAEIDCFHAKLNDRTTSSIPFTSLMKKEDWEDMQWYLEAYPTQYAADVDDSRADRIVAKLKIWGQGLFNAVFSDLAVYPLFCDFRNAEKGEGRQITIAASQPEILRLPWELLCDPSGTYLVHENLRIAVRRRLAGAEGGRKPAEAKPKAQLRLLMVVSRPDGVEFLDPRSEAQAVLQAIEQTAPGRVVVEFLRSATLTKLVERLENRKLPAIDIVHFDGHGKFDGGMGYLVFEDEDGKKKLVSADDLGDALNCQQVSLMVLSACKSAMVTGDDALGCVAARLTHSGIPAVLAMTYSVLVTTTEQLFGKFYGELAGGESLGVALANARRDLFLRKQRGKTWRGTEQVDQNLSDWFLPALYQAGDDIQLLHPSAQVPQIESPRHQLPQLAAEGFFGRSRDLWEIERAFLKGKQRLTISGFGGQGKTYLALEAGRWMSQTGMFDVVCFVNYAAFQGVDPVGFAVWEIGMVLEQSFLDAAAVTVALAQQRTLLILDNLESLEAEALQELLTVAKEWSKVGKTRLLLTTRNRDLNHPDYPVGRSLEHQRLLLKGLGDEQDPEDAINYFQSLMKLPPEPTWGLPTRAELIDLFKLVDFHPLSIKSVAEQCKERRVDDLEQSLKQLLAEVPKGQDEQRSLIASLNLSLQRLDKDLLDLLPKLGVFQGGAFDLNISPITELSTEQWQQLKFALERTGLMQVENIGIPFLRFHPTLAPVLWGRLSVLNQRKLKKRHQQFYYIWANQLHDADSQNPSWVRSIAKRELPNLLWAVKGSLEDQSEDAVAFVDRVNRFLYFFGLERERAFLSHRISQLINEKGSNNWFLVRSNQGEQLYQSGRYPEAAAIFAEVLQGLGTEESFNRVRTLLLLARCWENQGQLTVAARYLQEGVDLSVQLDPSEKVKRQRGLLQVDLGDVLTALGEFEKAQQAYEAALAICEELGDLRMADNTKVQMGTLAMLQNNLETAFQLYQESLQTFRQRQELGMQATVLHQLGIVYEKATQWELAERAYREAASIKERQKNTSGAATTYNQLAILSQSMNQPIQAESWYRKALQSDQTVGNKSGESKQLHNLAYLLASQPNRLLEARQIAAAALEIKQTLDSAAAEIWKTYDLLSEIATAQGEMNQAREYRQLARSAKAAYAGSPYQLQKHFPFIEFVVAAVGDESMWEQLELVLTYLMENGVGQLVAAIRQLLDGERSLEFLWADLNAEDSMIIAAILRGVSEL